MSTDLCQLAIKYACDKTPTIRHSYTPYYHRLFQERKIQRVFEIGVCGGASLRMWRDYFPSAEIFGIDNDPSRIFLEDRIHTACCDASNRSHLTSVAQSLGGHFDLIVDDGSHYPEHQISSFHTLVPFLTLDGIYIIEDVLHIERVSNMISFPHEIHRFNNCTSPNDDTFIVYFQRQDITL